MAGLGPLRQVAHLSGRVPVLEGLEPSQLTPHHSGRPEELTTTDWSYSSQSQRQRLAGSTWPPSSPGTRRPSQAKPLKLLLQCFGATFFFCQQLQR